MTLHSRLLALTSAVLTMSPTAASAETWPSRPLRVLVPFTVGGSVDSVARVTAAKLQEIIGQPVIIENKPGVGGNLAADLVAKSAPDGYTILQNTVGQTMSPSLYKQLPYDTEKDLIPVTQLIESALLLVATPTLPANDLRELVALAKAEPGRLNSGNTGVGNPLHLAMEMLTRATDIKIQGVAFRGDAPIMQALMSGDIHVAIFPVATGIPSVEGGQVKALAVSTARRIRFLPNVPTIAEQGVPGFAADSWQGWWVPTGTPREIVDRLWAETKKALTSPDVAKRMDGLSAEVVASSPAEFAVKVKADIVKYAKIVKDANIPLQ